MNRKALTLTIIAAIALLALAALIWGQYDKSNQSNETQAPNTTQTEPENSESVSEQSESMEVTMVYRNDGFVKSTLEVNAGDNITVKNDSDSVLDFASDDHPSHQKQSELNIGEIAPGQSKTFIIDTKGTWGFHNHENAAHSGTLIVK